LFIGPIIGLKTVKLLRNIAAEKLMGGLTLRKVLLVFQFTLSLVTIIFLIVFDRQFEFMAKADPGYRMDNIVTVPITSKGGSHFSTAISMIPGVELIGTSSASFGRYVTGAVSVSQRIGYAQ
jgi:putative ABC transport system permease protein